MKTKIQNLKTFLLILLPLYFLLLGIGCKKEKEEPQLPAETQTGANTFGCYVNGELFVKDGSAPWMHRPVEASLQIENQILILESYTKESYMYIEIQEPKANISIPVSIAYYRTSEWPRDCFCFSGKETGELFFTKLDTVNRIVSGRFQFQGQCSNEMLEITGDSIVSITNGRFDIKLDIYDNDN